MAVIAMTREMATLGKDVAAGVADRLGLAVVHHELVEHDIAERAGLRESEVHRFLEGEATLLERWKIDRQRLSRYTAEEILELAVKGNVLIRGWGATYLLRLVPHVICVRICAPMAFREQVLMRRLGIENAALARREIGRNDAAHNVTMQRIFGVNWLDATLYAIVLNTERVPVEDCVQQIVALTRSPAFQETARSRGALMDELVLCRVRAVLDQHFGSGIETLGGIEPTVSEGKVMLTGATTDRNTITEAVRLTRAVKGVKAVDNRIAHVTMRAT
ncbi:MAG: BON domain-containing protein [Hyphomicrobiaceae bacterium]|nr:MAG: BON domain-containing protein [Hyphomicrobiaceae bacterium]